MLKPHCPSDDSDVTPSLLHLSVSNIIRNFNESSDRTELAALFKITFEQMQLVEQHTRQQRKSTLWHELRANRITASNFGAVLAAADRQTLSDSLFSKLKGVLLLFIT